MNLIKTPCWIINQDAIATQTLALRRALHAHFEAAEIGFSVKTNSLPAVLRTMHNLGCMAEAVSHDEWHLALLCGFEAKDIIYNGPLKSKDTFIDAITNGAIVNIETKREIEWLRELPRDRHYNVGLRLNINLSRVSGKDAVRQNDNSRFGFSDETDELSNAIDELRAMPHVSLAGLHIHRTTQARRVNYYRHAVRYAAITAQKYNLRLKYLDIGGGFFGTLPGKPEYGDYINAIHSVLDKFNMADIKILVEPGTALIDNAAQFVVEAIDTKKVDDETIFVTTNGSRFDIDPFFRKKLYICRTIPNDDSIRQLIACQTICGCTCIEEDRITKLENQAEIKVGDHIIFNHVGAYTMTLTPLFIRYFPQIYLHTENGYELVRTQCDALKMYQLNNS